MTDYLKNTGTSGKMLIRDTGTTIEFWINSGNSSTWSDHIPWSGTVNNVGVSGSYYYHPNSAWQRVGVWGVTYSQNVTFVLGNTGTSGFGGPTTHGPIFINRVTVPPAPTPVSLSNVTATSVDVTYVGQGDGGAFVDHWQIGYGTDPTYPQQYIELVTGTISGLTPGTRYYFWAQGHNSAGWGYWSSRTDTTTQALPAAPPAPIIAETHQTSLKVNYLPDGSISAGSYTVGWGTSPVAPTSTASTAEGVLTKTITGLNPYTVYYVWTKSTNVWGTGPWSPSTMVRTVAGAWVKRATGPEFDPAIPYVKVSGVWKIAQPWVRIAGEWKETS